MRKTLRVKLTQLTIPYAQRVAGWYKIKLCYSFQFFHGTPDARLGYEVIKPRCLNTSTYFWTFSVRRACQEYQIQMLNLFNGRSGRSFTT